MAVAFVKQGGINSNKNSAASLALTVPTTGHAAGNLVYLAAATVGNANGWGITPPSDSRGNTYTLIGAAGQLAASSISGAIWWSKLTTSLLTGDTITVTANVSVSAMVVGSAEFSGVTTTTNGLGGSSGSSATPQLASPPTTTDATDLCLGMVIQNGPTGDTFSNDTGTWDGSTWQTLSRVGTIGGSATSNVTLNMAYLITSATGSVNFKPTITSRAWFDSVQALQGAAVATAPVGGVITAMQAVQRAAMR